MKLDQVKTSLEGQIDDVRAGVNNTMAIQLNSLRKWLDDCISPVSALVQIGDSKRYIVAKDFPTTVRDFWKLKKDTTALI